MKKFLLSGIILISIVSFTAVSCSTSSAKELYQCPMKCEGEKTYDAPGTCPVCKMELRVKK